MIIRILPHLDNRQAWIDFCQREAPYCFIERPDVLVDFQSSHLIITLLNRHVRNGKQAVKYSIGARQSVEPAWNFIKACSFSLTRMVEGLQLAKFESNARDQQWLAEISDISIRKFFAKEQAIISPAFLGSLEALATTPQHWELYHGCQLLANGQFQDLRSELQHLDADRLPAPDSHRVLLKLLQQPEHWQLKYRKPRLWLYHKHKPYLSLIADLTRIDTTPAAATTPVPFAITKA